MGAFRIWGVMVYQLNWMLGSESVFGVWGVPLTLDSGTFVQPRCCIGPNTAGTNRPTILTTAKRELGQSQQSISVTYQTQECQVAVITFCFSGS